MHFFAIVYVTTGSKMTVVLLVAGAIFAMGVATRVYRRTHTTTVCYQESCAPQSSEFVSGFSPGSGDFVQINFGTAN